MSGVNQRLGDVERLAALDALELDGPQSATVLGVVPDDAVLARQCAPDGVVAHGLDHAQVLAVRPSRAGEVAALLHHRLLRAQPVGQLLGEPLAGVERVDARVAVGVALHLLAGGFFSATIVSMPAPSERKMLTLPARSMMPRSRSDLGVEVRRHLRHVHARCTSHSSRSSPTPGAHSCWSSQ